MFSLKTAAFALALLGSSMLVGHASAAMPVNGLAPAKAQIADNVQHVWCGPYRCWGPGWRRYAWGYRPRWGWRGGYYRPWGGGYGRWAYGTGWW